MAPSIAVKEHSYVGKLNFWSRVIWLLIDTLVSKRCYNSVGNKTKEVENFIAEQLSISTDFSEYAASTLIVLLNTKLVPFSHTLALEYENAAEKHYEFESAEYRYRVRNDFIRSVQGDDEINGSNPYDGVVMMASVSLLAQNLLKDPFKFNKKQILDMDGPDDVDGRCALKWHLRLTCLLVELGFTELTHPDETLFGRRTIFRDTKNTAIAVQKQKDDIEEANASSFQKNCEENDSDYEEDTKNMEAFGDSRQRDGTTGTHGRLKKRRAKKQGSSAEKYAAGEATLQGDQIDIAMAYMTSADRKKEEDAEIRRKEDREDRRDYERNERSERLATEHREFQDRMLSLLVSNQLHTPYETPQLAFPRQVPTSPLRHCNRCGYADPRPSVGIYCPVCNGMME